MVITCGNPKSKNHEGNRNNNKGALPTQKADAQNMDTDSDTEMAEMDQALQIVQLDENKVHETAVELEVLKQKETSTSNTCPCIDI